VPLATFTGVMKVPCSCTSTGWFQCQARHPVGVNCCVALWTFLTAAESAIVPSSARQGCGAPSQHGSM
jgi:hypothetical protein